MILDGYGLNQTTKGNAVAEAKTPVMDKLMKEYPFVRGNASGLAVGLPDGQMGNSEVGHLNMGACEHSIVMNKRCAFPNSCYIVPIARAASHNKSRCNG